MKNNNRKVAQKYQWPYLWIRIYIFTLDEEQDKINTVMEDRKLSEKRIFPAINIQRSGTRREDLLLSKEEQEIVYALHREMSGNRAEENMEQILNFFKRTKNNKEFIQVMKHSLLKK